jgi:hypothetical protein
VHSSRSVSFAHLIAAAALVALLTSCAGAFEPISVPADTVRAGLPGPGTVRDGRFVVPVELDGGRLLVRPAPATMKPAFPERRAATEIWANPAISEGRGDTIIGFGLVTSRVSAPDVARVRRLPAWVGFAWGRVVVCPMEPPTAGARPPSPLPSNGYIGVVVGAADGVPAFTYRARSSFCGRPPTGPTVALATQTLSIPWRQVGSRRGGKITISFQLPPCGRLVSTSVSGGAAVATVEVDATTPDVPLPCPAPVGATSVVDVGAASMIRHAPVDPVDRRGV